MRALRFLPACLAACLLGGASLASQPAPNAWPAPQREHKPWTRWWWPASAVDKASLTRQLEQIAAANLGGVEITPIYGAKGYEDRYIDFLSPEWMEMLEHVGARSEAARPRRRHGHRHRLAVRRPWRCAGGLEHELILLDGGSPANQPKMMVKRAGPGGEGLVLDPYSPAAMQRYLAPFTKAFAGFPRGLVRGQFHDSFEYYEGRVDAAAARRLPADARLRHPGVRGRTARRQRRIDAATLGAREERLPRNARPAAPRLPRHLGGMVPSPRLHRPQPVARRSGQPPRSVRQHRRARDGAVRLHAVPDPGAPAPRRRSAPRSGPAGIARHPDGVVGRARDGTSAGLEREQHVAPRALEESRCRMRSRSSTA